ncbi:MAG: squalene/phytoene synthase family protein [Hyphomonadaceae bacterium]|nr:squalene/phytoene synthase family protein [Hyphomonadaceae bacterium]
MAPPDPLDAHVRSVDEDRWLASRFAPRHVRPRLLAIYALNYEIARTAEAVTHEGIGDLRLAWWSEAVAEIYEGKPVRAHPALEAFERAVKESNLPRPAVEEMIAARGKDLEQAPFDSWGDLDAYLEATAGNVFRLAIEACAESPARPKQFDTFVRNAARAWGYAGLLRALPFWTARGRTFFPHRLMAHNGLAPNTVFQDFSGHAARSCTAAVLDRGRHAYNEARELATLLPSALFPAIGYLAFAPRYFKALTEQQYSMESSHSLVPLLARQMALMAASATGKV